MNDFDKLLLRIETLFGQSPAREWLCDQIWIWLRSAAERPQSYEKALPEDESIPGLEYLPEDQGLPWPPEASNEANIPEYCAVLAAVHDVHFQGVRFIPLDDAATSVARARSNPSATRPTDEELLLRMQKSNWLLLREAVKIPGVVPDEAIEQAHPGEFLGELEEMLLVVEASYQAYMDSFKSRRPYVNDRMIAEMSANLEEVKGWTAQKWANRLGCAESTVKETKTWKSLALLRQQTKAEKRKDRSRGKPR